MCLCVFVTLSGACHLRAAWLDLAVSLEATADSTHLGRSNEFDTQGIEWEEHKDSGMDGNKESEEKQT